MKRYLSLIALCALCIFSASPGISQPQVLTRPFSTPIANVTSLNGSIPNTSTTVTLADYSTKITIWTSSDAANMYVNFNGNAATTSNAIIYPGASLTITVFPTKTFKIIGASAAGTYNVVAY